MKTRQVEKLLTKHEEVLFGCKYTVTPYVGNDHEFLNMFHQVKVGEEPTEADTIVRTNCAKILNKELIKISKPEMIAIGSDMYDPYQNAESSHMQTKEILEVIKHHKFPVHIITRSSMIERDISLLKEISEYVDCFITICVSTMEPKLAQAIEPTVVNPLVRMKTVEMLSNAGLDVGVGLLPLFPHITDSDEQLDAVFKAASKHGAKYILDKPFTLDDSKKDIFYAYVESNTKLKKFANRYKRLYKIRSAPYGPTIKRANRELFDLSLDYEIPRILPLDHEFDSGSDEEEMTQEEE